MLSCSWVEAELWVASSDSDADFFVYLEDFDPAADCARYVTEGCLRASHRKEHAQAPAEDPRAAAHLPGQSRSLNHFHRKLGCNVMEGCLRASHRKEHAEPPPDDPRAAAHLPGMWLEFAHLQPAWPQPHIGTVTAHARCCPERWQTCVLPKSCRDGQCPPKQPFTANMDTWLVNRCRNAVPLFQPQGPAAAAAGRTCQVKL